MRRAPGGALLLFRPGVGARSWTFYNQGFPRTPMRPLFRFLLPLAVSALAAQGAKPALDVLPEKALGFLLFRDPVLSQVKLQGFMQRAGMKGDDPLTEAQKAFGLPLLPAGRQGMAIVYLEDTAAGAGGSQREAVYLSPPDGA